jgi:hypothetical protein
MNGWRGQLYYAVFPLDLFGPNNEDRLMYEQTKLEELLPLYGWLVPLIVYITGTTTHLSWFPLVVFFAVEAGLLALITKFHLKLEWNQVTEVWLNLLVSMVAMASVFGIVAFFLGSVSNPEIDWN